ncbi:HNH endonuclease [Vibrio breoganii]
MESNNLKKKLIERDGLRCSVTCETVNSPRDLSIEHITPKSKGGTSDLDNLILIKNDLNRSIADNESYRTKLLVKELEQRQQELNIREKEAFERESSYRMQIEKQKSQLDEYHAKLNEDQKERQVRLAKEEEERKIIFMQQQEQMHKYEMQMKIERDEIKKLQSKVKAQELQLEKEKDKYREESRKSIEQKSSAYVNDALNVLEGKESQYHNISRLWSICGAISIAAGIFILSYLGVEGFAILEKKDDVSWSFLLLITFKGLIVVGLFVALAKYSFTFSQSYMHESLKNSERRHAINFGKFYLESYGADADWSQIKEAFEHWNISSNTAFSNNKADSFDPKTLENAASIIQAVSKFSPTEKKTAGSDK